MRLFIDIVEDAGRLGFPAPLLTLAALYGRNESAQTLEALVVAGGGGHETRSGVPNALWLIPVSSALRDNEDVLELRFEHVPFYVHAISEHDHWLLLVLTAATLEFLTVSRATAPSLQHRYALAVPAPCCRPGQDRGTESVGTTATRRTTELDGRLRWRWASVAGPWLAAVYEDNDPRIWLLHWPSACRYAALDPSASSERARILHEVHRNILLPCGFVYGAEDDDTPLWAQTRLAGVERFCSGAFTNDASWLALTCTAKRNRPRSQISLAGAGGSKEINDTREYRDEHSVDARPCLVLLWLRRRLGDPSLRPETGLASNTHAADESKAIFLDIPLNNQVRRPARRVRAPTPGPCVFLGTKALITTVVNSDGTTVASLWRHAAIARGPSSQHSWSLWRSWQLTEQQPVTALSVFAGSVSNSPNEWPVVLGVAVANGTLQSYIVRPTRGCTTRTPLLCTSWLRHHHRRGWRRAPATSSALPSKAFDLVHDLPSSALVVVPWIDERAPLDAGADTRRHASTEWLLCSSSPDGTLVWIKLRQALAWTLVERALRFLFLYLLVICATRIFLFE